jgi:hypothetical protein
MSSGDKGADGAAEAVFTPTIAKAKVTASEVHFSLREPFNRFSCADARYPAR